MTLVKTYLLHVMRGVISHKQKCVTYQKLTSCVVQSLTSEAAMTLVHSFVSTCLDYCNCVLYGIADNQLQRLQFVEKSAT